MKQVLKTILYVVVIILIVFVIIRLDIVKQNLRKEQDKNSKLSEQIQIEKEKQEIFQDEINETIETYEAILKQKQ